MRAHGRLVRTRDQALCRPQYATVRETIVESLAAGLCAVHAAEGGATRIFYCEPMTGRCTCGAPRGLCPHIAQTNAVLTHPLARRRGA